MVVYTMFATIDSLTLLAAMTGLTASSMMSLKAIADLEHDLINSVDFFSAMKTSHRMEYAFMVVNILANVPFLFNWWMAVPQVMWAVLKFARLAVFQKLEEQDVFKQSVYSYHRRWHMSGFFLYLISWFIYFARFITAVMDIHVHGISPYD
uniref:ER-derived vesicles protein ERV14 n=1 Tax=Alexandrium andersonii TaxID=327968 RepID=A0A7S2DE51_9DINO|mmetsp:Transcript_52258/g.117979  ORF Transcript_52258/g.117979 Transcript_52258/m.117979 type:complete len:151 (+) Transcript_52258:96-548(+)